MSTLPCFRCRNSGILKVAQQQRRRRHTSLIWGGLSSSSTQEGHGSGHGYRGGNSEERCGGIAWILGRGPLSRAVVTGCCNRTPNEQRHGPRAVRRRRPTTATIATGAGTRPLQLSGLGAASGSLAATAPVSLSRAFSIKKKSFRDIDATTAAQGEAARSSNDDVTNCSRKLSALGKLLAAQHQNHVDDMVRKLSPLARKEIISVLETLPNYDAHSNNSINTNNTNNSSSISNSNNNINDQHQSNEPATEEPSKRDIRLVALNQAIPFVGFGFMDNFLLIIAGEAIDMTLGVMLGISTMFAAAMGNIISDLSGVLMGTVIEDYCARLGVPTPNISQAQRQLRSVRFAGQWGCAIGLTIGCVLGMFPLLWIDSRSVEIKKKEMEMDHLFRDVVTEAKSLIGAQVLSLFLVMDSTSQSDKDKDGHGATAMKGKKYFLAKYANGIISDENVLRSPLGPGVKSRVVRTGEVVNLVDARNDPDYDPKTSVLGPATKSLMCVPVFDSHGHVIAVIQAANKIDETKVSSIIHGDNDEDDAEEEEGFTYHDMRVLQALASHLSVHLTNNMAAEKMNSFRDVIRLLKDQETTGGLPNAPAKEMCVICQRRQTIARRQSLHRAEKSSDDQQQQD